jgi:hypothetical protein
MDSGEARAKLDGLLNQFGTITGASGLTTEENGVCVLAFDGGPTLYLLVDHTTANLLVWSTIGALPADKTEATLRTLMRANLFFTETQGATLGLMPDSDSVVLAIRRPVDAVDGEGLRGLIELMVERAEALAPVARGDEPPSAAGEHEALPFSSAIRG